MSPLFPQELGTGEEVDNRLPGQPKNSWISVSVICGNWLACPSQCRAEVLPLLFLLRHKCEKTRIFSQVIQLSVAFEKQIVRKALIGRHLQPLHRLLGLMHQSVCGSNVVRRVMKVSVAASDLDCVLDRGFGFAVL